MILILGLNSRHNMPRGARNLPVSEPILGFADAPQAFRRIVRCSLDLLIDRFKRRRSSSSRKYRWEDRIDVPNFHKALSLHMSRDGDATCPLHKAAQKDEREELWVSDRPVSGSLLD